MSPYRQWIKHFAARCSRVAKQTYRLFTMQNVEQQHGVNLDAKTRFHYVAILANYRQAGCPLFVRAIISGSTSNV